MPMAYVQYLELASGLPEVDKMILRFKIQAVLQLWLLIGLYVDEKIVKWANWNYGAVLKFFQIALNKRFIHTLNIAYSVGEI